MAASHYMSQRDAEAVKERIMHSSSLWAEEADCQWWEQHLPALHISSFEQLKVLHKRKTMIERYPEGKHAFWALALTGKRGAKDNGSTRPSALSR